MNVNPSFSDFCVNTLEDQKYRLTLFKESVLLDVYLIHDGCDISVFVYQVYTGLDFRRNLQVVNKTGYSTELYTEEAKSIIDAHNTSEVGLICCF